MNPSPKSAARNRAAALATAFSLVCAVGPFTAAAALPAKPTPAASASGVVPNPEKKRPAPAIDAAGTYKETEWDALVPKDWDPMKNMKGLNFSMLDDASPKAMDALKKMQDEWNAAPANAEMNDARIRIPGYIVPLDGEKDALREFLLVPYFGACIHVPPPPANQIIHVVATRPAKGFRTMDAVWVSGTLHVEHAESMMGDSGYKMDGEVVEKYQPPKDAKAK